MERPDLEAICAESQRGVAACWAHFDFDECLPHGDCECGGRTALELLAYITHLESQLQTAKSERLGAVAEALDPTGMLRLPIYAALAEGEE